jgi:branched-chain amino acid transport system permease protein
MVGILIGGVDQAVLYTLMGLGLVLVYRQSRILNFAHGVTVSMCGYVAYVLLQHGAPYLLAVAGAVAAGVLLATAIDLGVVRMLSSASDFAVATATLGVALLLIGVMVAVWGTSPVALPPPIGGQLTVGGVTVGTSQVLALALTVVLIGAIFAGFKYTRFGVSMRAVSEGRVTSQLMGINVKLIQTLTWSLAGALAATAALFLVPANSLDPYFPTSFMVGAFAAITLGGLESIGGLLIGSLIFGVGTSLFAFYVTGQLSQTLAFGTILVIFMWFPNGLLGRRLLHVNEPGLPSRRRFQLRKLQLTLPKLNVVSNCVVMLALGAVIVVVLIALPKLIPGSYVFAVATALAFLIAVYGQSLVSGHSGQASIGQAGFMVVGAYVSILADSRYNWPYWLAVLAAVAASVIIGAIVAIPVARLSGVYLAVLTLGFALAAPELAQFPTSLTNGANGIQPKPFTLFGLTSFSTNLLYYLTLAVAVVVLIAVRGALALPAGRLWVAVRDSERGAASLGVNVARRKVEVFALGAGLAGLGGALSALLVGFVSPDSFTLWTSVYLLVAVIVGGSSSTLGPIIGSAFVILVPTAFSSYPQIAQMAFGAALLLILVIAPQGIAPQRTSRRAAVVSAEG